MTQDNMNIQWYPGHMTKTRRQIEADLKLVDAVCEIVDARIPVSSRNPDIDSICGNKPRIVVMNRMDLADPNVTKAWLAHFRSKGMAAVATDCKSRKGIAAFQPAVRLLLKEKIERDASKGMNKPLRVMVVGIPNVGKSTLINQISGRKGAKAENRPGVTRGKQWVTVDNVIDTEELSCHLAELLNKYYPQTLKDRYGVDLHLDMPGYMLLEELGRKRGYLLAKGEINTERMAKVLLDEYRSGKLGYFTLEMPEDSQ